MVKIVSDGPGARKRKRAARAIAGLNNIQDRANTVLDSGVDQANALVVLRGAVQAIRDLSIYMEAFIKEEYSDTE